MKNPWEGIALSVYEAHMGSGSVLQLQQLNRIMRGQFQDYRVKTAAIWGVAGGNGLEHAVQSTVETLYGLDINRAYLTACRERFGDMGGRLRLIQLDLRCQTPPHAELVIADLLIEYIGIEMFLKRISQANPTAVSCVIQEDAKESFVSDSPYLHAFDGLSTVHTQIGEPALTKELNEAGFIALLSKKFSLPNGKRLLRLDYQKREGQR